MLMERKMDITPVVPAGRQIISAYGDGNFRIAGTVWSSPILVFPTFSCSWDVSSPESLTAESFRSVQEYNPGIEIVLIGGGRTSPFLPTSLRQVLGEMFASCDVMDTGAACRTFNVLLAEDRRVAAALFPV
ncbi:hypothetical protein HEQ62_01620 [Haematospirillum jordaniae]|nr:hypothetical protein [Haematospirillum jordaniae]NKD56424.1 hypothetical protein [Haematospirillum jordaniae]NKD58482.1 hypothetical protein [Haematospirillum jordaniae]NKD66349.1 hypothetical protein [Haematospirillum jordaniae]NKD78484.1 hypothetical protein [Haematospirillum jordaniae]